MRKRETEIEPPTFEKIEEFHEYARRRDEPQKFLDEFIAQLKGIKPSVKPIFDAKLINAGSVTVVAGKEKMRIGEKALIRDSELFKTVFHEEGHLRLRRKASKDIRRALELVTNPDRFPEEEAVEKAAIRYLRFYERRFGKFKH
jgi:hypothetical protein